jgi:hypothetical protein
MMRFHRSLVPAMAVLIAASGSASAAPPGVAGGLGPGIVNLAHLDFLHDSVPYPAAPPPGHATTEPGSPIDTWWVYANFDATTGTYTRTGGGAYDPATNTYGQGAFDTDDVTRAAIVYLTHFQLYGDRHSLDMARAALRFVLYMQTTSGPNAGNFVLWMQPDGALDPTPTPPDQPNPADAGASYWLARSIWAIGVGYQVFHEADPAFASALATRMRMAMAKLDKELVGPNYGHYLTLHGYQTPAWLISDGADASSEALLGLDAFIRATGDPEARTLALDFGTGIAGFQLGSERDWPWLALMPWARSVSDWHAWAAHMTMALADAAQTLHRPDWRAAARRDASAFDVHQQLSFGAINGLTPAPNDLSQIAYGNETTVDGLLAVGATTADPVFERWAGIAAGWLLGDNPAATPMYQPATGVVFDGINGDGSVNRNSGAESTIEGLLSLMNAVNDPEARPYLGFDTLLSRFTYQKVEAESGTLGGGAVVVTPASSWTGEAMWSNGQYVDLGTGGSDSLSVTAPASGRYLLYIAFDKQIAPPTSVGVTVSVDGVTQGTDWEGGAGVQGDSPNPDYLWIDSVRLPRRLAAGQHTVALAFTGTGAVHARLDAVLLQPEVESTLLADAGGHELALYKSLAGGSEEAPLPSGRWRVQLYDHDGRPVGTSMQPGGGAVDVPAYGFAFASSR